MATRPARRTLQEAAVESLRNDLDEAGESRLYDVMGRFWHPVMYSSDLQGSPAKVILMEQQLVVVRLAGQVRCFPDLCVHRGTALSLARGGRRDPVRVPRLDVRTRWRLHVDPRSLRNEHPESRS